MASKKTLIVAAANAPNVASCIRELQKINLENVTLLTTQKLRIDQIDHYLDVDVKMLSEEVLLPLNNFDNCIVIQHSRTLVPYMNVFKFLKENMIENIAIKTLGRNCIETTVSTLLGNINYTENSDDVFWLSPQHLQFCAGVDTLHFGQTVDGDWDIQTVSFEQSVLFYSSLFQRFENQQPWNETSYYKDLLKSVNERNIRFNCHSESDVAMRCEKLESLFLSIKDEGWKQLAGEDFVTVNIGRDGEVLFADGRHRLSIAKFLKLDEIPVKIAIRHKKWQEFKAEIATYAKENGGQIYAPLNHIDLQEFSYNHEDKRFELIINLISQSKSTVLDIGSHWGRACAELEDAGHICTAVEGQIGNFYFLNKFKQIDNRNYTAIDQNIFDFVDQSMTFDVVLALNIFHHFTKTKQLFEKFITLLSRLDMQEMFLQTHDPMEPQMKNAYRNFDGEQFVAFIIQHSELNSFNHVADIAAGRKLYHLKK